MTQKGLGGKFMAQGNYKIYKDKTRKRKAKLT